MQVDRCRSESVLVTELLDRHHRVQSGKMDGGMPKRDWIACDSSKLLRPSPRFQRNDRPSRPVGMSLTHPGCPAIGAQLQYPYGIAVDSEGNLYIADTFNNRIREVSSGAITTVAGEGNSGFSGDGGPAASARLNWPWAVAVDSSGALYIADGYSRIRKLSNGVITTVAGDGNSGFSGDGGPAACAQLAGPEGITADSAEKVYVADTGNDRIRLLTPSEPGILPAPSVCLVHSAGQFGASSSIAPGIWIEIYGANLAPSILDWSNAFNRINAPTSLNGTSVTIGGELAFLDYVSPSQVNAQVPSTVDTGPQEVTVSTGAGTSAPYNITVNATQPGLWAPQFVNINGMQYVGATFPDYTTYVLPTGAVTGITSRPAHPGETIYLFGIGFGDVTPNIPAGQIVQQVNSLNSPVHVMFFDAPYSVWATPATLTYAGLAPGFIGLYLFKVVVPNVPTSDASFHSW
jgi:uncharacterized protein (TIGR03437 family)